MKGVFGRFIALILLVALIIFISLGFVLIKKEKAEEAYAREVVEQFLQEVLRDGEITVEEYEKLRLDLERNGILYDIDISVGKPNKGYSD